MTQRQIDALKNEAEKEAQKKIEEKRYSVILSVFQFEWKYSRMNQVNPRKTAVKIFEGVWSD